VTSPAEIREIAIRHGRAKKRNNAIVAVLARGSADPALNLNSRRRCGIRLFEILAFACVGRHAKNRLQVGSRLFIFSRCS